MERVSWCPQAQWARNRRLENIVCCTCVQFLFFFLEVKSKALRNATTHPPGFPSSGTLLPLSRDLGNYLQEAFPARNTLMRTATRRTVFSVPLLLYRFTNDSIMQDAQITSEAWLTLSLPGQHPTCWAPEPSFFLLVLLSSSYFLSQLPSGVASRGRCLSSYRAYDLMIRFLS